MMTPNDNDNTLDRDPDLQALFAQEYDDVHDPSFTASIMVKIKDEQKRAQRLKMLIGLIGLGLMMVFSGPLMSFGLLISNGLSTPIVAVGDGALDQFMSPFNSYAFPLAMIGFGINKFRKIIFK